MSLMSPTGLSDEAGDELRARRAASLLRTYYDARVAEAATAVQMSSESAREEALDMQANIAIGILSPILGGPAVLCGLSTERAHKSLWQYGIPLNVEGGLDFKSIAGTMFREDVQAELEARAQEEALTAGAD